MPCLTSSPSEGCELGPQRFVDLARGVNGVGFRLAAKIDGISPVQPISLGLIFSL